MPATSSTACTDPRFLSSVASYVAASVVHSARMHGMLPTAPSVPSLIAPFETVTAAASTAATAATTAAAGAAAVAAPRGRGGPSAAVASSTVMVGPRDYPSAVFSTQRLFDVV